MASINLDPKQRTTLENFIQLCKHNPAVLHSKDLAFFREWIER